MTVYLVTGANGFVGRRVCADLAERGHRVIATVRSTERVQDVPEHPAIELRVAGAIDGTTDWQSALAGCQAVIHLAGRVHDPSVTDLEAYRRVNVDGTMTLAEQAAREKIERFVFVSTIKAQTLAGADGPLPEDADCPPPVDDPYGLSKLETEHALLEGKAVAGSGMSVTVIRPPLVYGPGAKGNILRLMAFVARHRVWPFGHIQNRRSMVYVGNLSDALIAATQHPAAVGKTFHVSDGVDLSTSDMIRHLRDALDARMVMLPFSGRLIAAAARVMGKRALVERVFGSARVDIGRIRGTLGWTPPYTPADGFAAMAEWFHATQSV